MGLKNGRGNSEIFRDASGLGFVALNVIDIWLTRLALGLGHTELNPAVLALDGHLEAKILASIAVVMVLWTLRKDRLLLPLNIGMLLVVLLNSTAVILESIR
ncbi:hypothetical protein ACFLXL_02390 [Chloroflexota bacterium]